MKRYVTDQYPQRVQAPAAEVFQLGLLEAQSGDHHAAIETLAAKYAEAAPDVAPLHDDMAMSLGVVMSAVFGGEALQALAWAYAETGQTEHSMAILDEAEKEFAALKNQGTLLFQWADVPYQYALNALMLGKHEQALDRLEAIIDSGWRAYYEHHLDPRWDVLRDHPRFQSLMARVRSDVDRQRAKLESIESHEGFVSRLSATLAAAGEDPE